MGGKREERKEEEEEEKEEAKKEEKGTPASPPSPICRAPKLLNLILPHAFRHVPFFCRCLVPSRPRPLPRVFHSITLSPPLRSRHFLSCLLFPLRFSSATAFLPLPQRQAPSFVLGFCLVMLS
ncbi:hypothetical protein E2C01_071540 [Portunus trituberculatus]|uniref:Uncharacterized protein n=1 Tax=Portunus trituberculatus TaxID=210409 RepID=A0A5B7I8G5_PORTR|nr:hypothetical protein [Portunus trituberculatus]